MSLNLQIQEREQGVYVVAVAGSLDTTTSSIFEEETSALLDRHVKALILDMEMLEYISSDGVRVILKAKKRLKEKAGELLLINLRPQIRKVFDIIKALPAGQLFSSIAELDRYLDKMQKKIAHGA